MQAKDRKIEIYEIPDKEPSARWFWVISEWYVEINQGASWVNVAWGFEPEYFQASIAAYKRLQELEEKDNVVGS